MSMIVGICFALLVRTFAFEPFNIPAQSMLPTLLPGDYVFVAKFPYGYSRYSFPFGPPDFRGRVYGYFLPERGDLVVFRLTRNPTIDFIKRIVGIPGDRIQMKQGHLYINDVPVAERRIEPYRYDDGGRSLGFEQYVETLPGGRSYRILKMTDDGPFDDTPVFTVPPGHYFMLGDNRDNSADSRVPESGVGYVPLENIVGRAGLIFYSTATGLTGVRTDRLFTLVW